MTRPLEWLRALPPPSKDLPVRQWAALVRLALAMKPDGSGWVTRERLAAEVAVSGGTVTRAVAWACRAGWLVRTSRGHRITDTRRAASTYRLCLPAEPNVAPNASLATDPTLQNSRPNVAPNAPLRGPLQGVLENTASFEAASRWPRDADDDTRSALAEELIDRLAADPLEERIIEEMTGRGCNPRMVENTIEARRQGR